MENFRSWLSGAKITGGLIVLGIVTLILGSFFVGQPTIVAEAVKPPPPSATATTAPAVVPAPAPVVVVAQPTCDNKFVQVAGDNASNRVDADFDMKYAAATASANNVAAAQKSVLLQNSANNGQRLAIWSNAFGLYPNPNNWKQLVNGKCLSAEGQALYYRFEGALSAKGTSFTQADAPANAFNSGISNGTYGAASSAGITGNRKAVKVTLSDGSVVWIMVRCGNVVFPNKPNLPEVPVDQPKPRPRPQPRKVCPPNMPYGTWPVCKDSPKKDPAARGNAPVGGGRNLDPGPGTYIPPTKMVRPPAAPRVNPPPPVVLTPKGTPAPPVGSTPDPAPAPAPEPKAPTPAYPATGCSPPPGMTTC